MAPPLIGRQTAPPPAPAPTSNIPVPQSSSIFPSVTRTTGSSSTVAPTTSGSASRSQTSGDATSTRPSPTRVSRPEFSSTPSPSPTSTGTGPFNMSSRQTGLVIAVIAIIASILGLFVVYIVLKAVRRRYKDPRYLPGRWLKNKWKNWDAGYERTSNPNQAHINRLARSRANIAANRALDRTNSVRSVITLPPYREMSDMDLERTIGREGERDGLDTIVALPETADEEEARREERMQAMYELRLQRRAQRAAREARQGGRSPGSTPSLANTLSSSDPALNAGNRLTDELAMETGGSTRTAGELTAVILNERSRRLSEVSYSDVGYARHDGSRIRSSSNASRENRNSDAQPLLGSGESARGRRSRSGSMLSVDTGNSRPSAERSRRDSAEILSGATTAATAANNTADIGDQRLPPSYDGLEWGDAPPYMSPVSPVSRSNTASSRARQGLNVPLVRVTTESNPNSPLTDRRPDQP